MAGCQPKWSRVNEDQPLCDNKNMSEKYSWLYYEFGKLEREDLIKHTKCLMPCSYMEYKVEGGDKWVMSKF